MIGRTTTSHPIAALLAALAAIPLAACGHDESPPSTPDAGSRPHADIGPPTAAAGPPTAARKTGGAPAGLGNGRHAVFGLRMPQGMTPAGTPQPGVYRFEGPHPPGVVESFLTAQLESFDPPVPEPSARLIRNAVVRKPIGGVSAGPLAIRLHERSDGTEADVWLEQKTDAADVTPDTSFGAPGSAGAQPAATTGPNGKYGSPAERRHAAFEVLQKIERGEPLTKQDLDNPMFQ